MIIISLINRFFMAKNNGNMQNASAKKPCVHEPQTADFLSYKAISDQVSLGPSVWPKCM